MTSQPAARMAGCHSLEAAAAGAYQVFYHHYFAAGLEIAFNEVFHAVIFGR